MPFFINVNDLPYLISGYRVSSDLSKMVGYLFNPFLKNLMTLTVSSTKCGMMGFKE